VSNAERAEPIADAELDGLFGALTHARGLVLAVSGGPDSTALLHLAARWRHGLATGPAMLAVTVDHGLRPEAKLEAAAVKAFAKQCGIAHRTLRWTGTKPKSRLQQTARSARYRLLAEAAVRFGADHILTAHTIDDQAETLLIRMSRGSGLTGLAGMAPVGPVPGSADASLRLARPLLGFAKARLIATLDRAGIGYADDPSNRDPRFTRARIRTLMPGLSQEGLDARRLSQLAQRMRRADMALEAATDAAWRAHVTQAGPLRLEVDRRLSESPAEVGIRLLGRAIARVGNEGAVELAKLEALHGAVTAAIAAKQRLRRTLAGALVTVAKGRLQVERAPARRRASLGGQRRGLNQGPTLLPQIDGTALK